MRKILIAPQRYVQGEGELRNIGSYITRFGPNALIVAMPEDLDRVRDRIDAAHAAAEFTLVEGGFGGEITRAEIERLVEVQRTSACDVIVGLGGGKALDTAKTVAHYTHKPCIVVPTIASTDAPCSALAVVYTPDGVFEGAVIFDRNPDVVLVDTEVIANAPVRFLVSGFGDALSTYFEMRSANRAYALNVPGANSTRAAIAIAEECYRILLEDSLQAKAAVEAGVVTPALENIIEANILLSGIGFESGGLGAAHSIHNGLTALAATHPYMHGEKVAFGVVVQLVLEHAESAEIDRILGYLRAVGLPTCLRQLGVEPTPENVRVIAEAAARPIETIHKMPFPVTERDVVAAIMVADAIGSR
jgi:glycerol dehydrogenase